MTARQAPWRGGSDGSKDTTSHIADGASSNEITFLFFLQINKNTNFIFSKIYFRPKKIKGGIKANTS